MYYKNTAGMKSDYGTINRHDAAEQHGRPPYLSEPFIVDVQTLLETEPCAPDNGAERVAPPNQYPIPQRTRAPDAGTSGCRKYGDEEVHAAIASQEAANGRTSSDGMGGKTFSSTTRKRRPPSGLSIASSPSWRNLTLGNPHLLLQMRTSWNGDSLAGQYN